MARRTTGRPCRQCRVGVHYGTGYCAKCEPTATTNKWAQHHKGRGTTKRGYGHEWEQIKKAVSVRDKGLCQPCMRKGVVTQATQVDHKHSLGNDGANTIGNSECICTPCHNDKTAQDRRKGKANG